MEFIALLLIIYFFIGACVCLLICVNPNDPGILGSMNRLVFRKFPASFRYKFDDVAIWSVKYLDKEC